MKCPTCQFENRDRAAFCGKCGRVLVRVCPRCSAESPGDHVFCDTCGCDLGPSGETPGTAYSDPLSYTPKVLADKILNHRSRIEGERKLVTVLFADVADYTAMAEKLDPEDVHQILGGCFRILLGEIHHYEGTVDKFTGDGLMALFGAPLAHEDHARRACHAALAIREAMREYGERLWESRGVDLRMRVGLNSGTVIVASVGDDLRMDYTAIGDTTNLASRLEKRARPGAILVSKNTHRLARDFFDFACLGEVRVKGKEAPQETYELVRDKGVGTRMEAAAARGLTPFVGRRREMEILGEAFDKARAGSGRIVGIMGDAGVGKSRLLQEFRNRLPQGEHLFLAGRCLHYGGSLVYLPVLDILRSYFDIQGIGRKQDVQKKVRDVLSRLDGNLPSHLSALQDVLSITVEDEMYLQLDPEEKKRRVFQAIRDLLIHASHTKPLVIVMEDLHWIDRTSQDFLDFFADTLAGAGVLLILLYRPEYRHDRGARTYCEEIPLDQLTARTTVRLVQSILAGEEVEPAIPALVLGKAGGNPLFVEELTQSLLENGSVRRENHRYVLAVNPSEVEVPDTIQAITSARMDRLEESQKSLLQVASVIGGQFTYSILRTIIGSGEGMRASLQTLQRLGFIYEKQLFPELEYIFKHALIQEAAYNSLLRKRRRELHAEIGEAIERIHGERLVDYYEVLAHHYVQGDNKAKAVEYLELSNQRAAAANSLEEAMATFDKAMELLDELPDTRETREKRISLLTNQSNVFFLLLKFTEYRDLMDRYEAVAAGLENEGVCAAFYSRLGWFQATLGDFDQAVETLTKADRLRERAAYVEDAGFLFLTEYICVMKSDYDRAFALYEDLLRAMEEYFHLRCYVRGLVAASQACAHLGRWDEAVEIGERALRRAHDFSDVSMVTNAEYALSAVYTFKREPDKAVRYAEQALNRAPTPGDRAMAQQFLGWAWIHGGQPGKGIELITGILPIFRATRFVMFELWCVLFLADGYWKAGEYEKGRKTAAELLEVAQSCGARYCRGHAHFLLAEMSLDANQEQAAAQFERSISVFQEIKAENALAMACAGFGRLHKRQGNLPGAREHLTRALQIFERLGTPIEPDKARKELAELPR